MARRHQRRTIERLLRRRQRDGLSYRELSEESGIPIPTLAWWAGKLERERAGRELVPVEVVEDDASDLGAAIEIVVRDGLRVLVPPCASDAHLRRVLRALASC